MVQLIARARQDSVTNRWYLSISDYSLREMRAKYWKSPGESRVESVQDEDEEENDMECLIKSLIESKIEVVRKDEQKIDSLISLVLDMRNDIAELKKI